MVRGPKHTHTHTHTHAHTHAFASSPSGSRDCVLMEFSASHIHLALTEWSKRLDARVALHDGAPLPIPSLSLASIIRNPDHTITPSSRHQLPHLLPSDRLDLPLSRCLIHLVCSVTTTASYTSATTILLRALLRVRARSATHRTPAAAAALFHAIYSKLGISSSSTTSSFTINNNSQILW